jgi:predicted HAD superfamily phosphohydrolase
MSKSTKKPVPVRGSSSIALPDAAYCRAARRIIEDAGVYSTASEEFDDIIADLDTHVVSQEERQYQRLIGKALASPLEAVHAVARDLDSTHNIAMVKRVESGYLLGVAVGLLLAGGR